MPQVLCEDARIGHADKNEAVRAVRRLRVSEDPDADNGPRRMAMRPGRTVRYDYDRKRLNENLGPLVRFLRARVGKPWDKVYAEIREANPKGSAVTEHIYEHLWSYVERNPVYHKDGKRTFVGTMGRYSARELVDDGHTFYVDRQGILRRPRKAAKSYRARQHEKNATLLHIGDHTYIERRESDGVWFRIEYAKQVREEYLDSEGNLAARWVSPGKVYLPEGLRGTSRYDYRTLRSDAGWYIKSVRTLSKSDKKHYGVK